MNNYSNLNYKGYIYTVYISPWKHNNAKYEIIKYLKGYRNLWERVSIDEYKKIKNELLHNN